MALDHINNCSFGSSEQHEVKQYTMVYFMAAVVSYFISISASAAHFVSNS
jgi:hypothetical protein